MAKRGNSSGDFNMAEEIRKLLTENREMTGREVINSLNQKFPKQVINENSCSVAYANARRKLGINSVRRKRPISRTGGRPVRTWTSVSSGSAGSASSVPGLDLLLAAKQLLQQCQGDAAVATAAIKQVAALQMK